MKYLAVADEDRAALAHLNPVYGSVLEDGRTIAKIQGGGQLPAGVEDMGSNRAGIRASQRFVKGNESALAKHRLGLL